MHYYRTRRAHLAQTLAAWLHQHEAELSGGRYMSRGFIVWLTGRTGAGKATTTMALLETEPWLQVDLVEVLDRACMPRALQGDIPPLHRSYDAHRCNALCWSVRGNVRRCDATTTRGHV